MLLSEKNWAAKSFCGGASRDTASIGQVAHGHGSISVLMEADGREIVIGKKSLKEVLACFNSRSCPL